MHHFAKIATLLLGVSLTIVVPVAAQSPSTSPSASPSAPASPALSPAPLVWTRFGDAGQHPKAREDHTLTVDPDGRAAYLFGGREADGTALGDLWRLDLDTDAWSRLSPDGNQPRPRFGHTGTWVPGVGLVVWAGQRGTTFFDDLWRFDPTADRWSRLRAEGPAPRARYGSCAALGPDGRLWVSHGFTDDLGRFDDTWAFDFDRSRWSDETPSGKLPTRRCLHDCGFTPDGRFLIYAGQTTGVPALGDLWSRTTDGVWDRESKPDAESRQLYGWAATGSDAFVFGGADFDGAALGDLWHLDLDTFTWDQLRSDGDGPPARSGATLIWDDVRSRLILFGGVSGNRAFDDLWMLPIATDPAVDPAGPIAPSPSVDAQVVPTGRL